MTRARAHDRARMAADEAARRAADLPKQSRRRARLEERAALYRTEQLRIEMRGRR